MVLYQPRKLLEIPKIWGKYVLTSSSSSQNLSPSRGRNYENFWNNLGATRAIPVGQKPLVFISQFTQPECGDHCYRPSFCHAVNVLEGNRQ